MPNRPDQALTDQAQEAYCDELRTALARARTRAADEHPGAVHDLEFGMPQHGRTSALEGDIDRIHAALLDAGCEIEQPRKWRLRRGER